MNQQSSTTRFKAERYLWFYLSVIYFLSLLSYLFDLLFCILDYGTWDQYIYSPFQYFPYYLVMGFWLIPASVIYNYMISHLLQGENFLRVLIGAVVGIVIALWVQNGSSYYNGEYRVLKNIITFATTGVTIELFRMLVVRLRLRDKRLMIEKENNKKARNGEEQSKGEKS